MIDQIIENKSAVVVGSEEIINHQLEFYKKNRAGCAFAALAAKIPLKYGWMHYVISTEKLNIMHHVQKAISNPGISTVSLIFPDVQTTSDLLKLIDSFRKCGFTIEEKEFDGYVCYGIRVEVLGKQSWVSGFGNFDFFPKTRQAPHTEIVLRVKEAPDYELQMKNTDKDVLHVAHMDMIVLTECPFKRLWKTSLDTTKKILGHKPNLLSAAKTTFSIPKKYIQ